MTDPSEETAEEDAPVDVADAVRSQRIQLSDYLDQLPPDAWNTASLCTGWTIGDVVAHLTLSTQTTWWDFAAGLIRARGSFDRMEAQRARTRADQYSPGELTAQLRDAASSPKRSPGSKPLDALTDVLVHGQDIARPLGDRRGAPAAEVAAALDHVLHSRFYGAKRRLAGLRLSATDATWTSGSGAQVDGPLIALLMAATGRPAGLEELSGAGVGQLQERIERTA